MLPLFDQNIAHNSIEEGHAIISDRQKPHSMAIDILVQVYTLKGLAMPTLQF
jgi:hypothetical protein